MTTTAQKALEDFEKTWLTTNWAAMTAANKQVHIGQHYALKIAVAKENEANRIESEAQQAVDTITRRNQAIIYLTNKGFACNNSLADWMKLYNHPHIFGSSWTEQANYQFSLGNDLDYFLQTAYNFWLEYITNN